MDEFWKQVCAWVQVWYSLFVMASIVLVLVVVSLFITPRDSGAFLVALLNVVIVLPTTVGLLYVLKRCRNERR